MKIAGDFQGATYVRELDLSRLTEQLKVVYRVMKDGAWRSVQELAGATGFKNDRSLEAQLRNLRKAQYGGWDAKQNPDGHMVMRRNRNGKRGFSEYRLMLSREYIAPGAPKSLTEAFNREMERKENRKTAERPLRYDGPRFRKDLFIE